MSRLYIRGKFIFLGLVLISSFSPGQTGAGPHATGTSVPSGSVETTNQNNNDSELPACCQEKIEYFKSRADKPASPEERAIINQVTDFMEAHPISGEELKRALHDVFGETAPKPDRPVTDFSEKIRTYTEGKNPGSTVSPVKGPAISGTPLGGAAGQGLTAGSNPPNMGTHPGIEIPPSPNGAGIGAPIVSGTKSNPASVPNSNGDGVSSIFPGPSPTVAISPSVKPVTPPVIPTPDNLNNSPIEPTAISPVAKPLAPPNAPPANSVSQPVTPPEAPTISRSNALIRPLDRDRSSNAPDFSYALTQNFQFNRPNPSPETRNEINTISPTPIPDFYAMAPKIAALPAEPIATKPTLSTPMTSPALEGIKKTVPNQVALSTLEPKLEKLNPVEIPKPSFSLEPLSFAKSTESASNPPVTPVPNPSPSSFSMPSSNSLVGASIPTLVLPLLQEKTKEGQWLAPVTNIAQEIPKRMPTNLSNPTTTPSGTSNTSIPVPAGTTAQNNSLAKENQATPSNVSGISTEIKAILNRSRTATSEKVEFTSNEPSEATRKLSSVEFAPTQFSESAPWKVVFLEKSGKQLSLANVLIAFGSTLLLIWILLMRLRRESKAAKATQSALLPIRKNDED